MVLRTDMILLQGMKGFFGTLMADGSKTNSRRLEDVMISCRNMGHVPRFVHGMEGEHHNLIAESDSNISVDMFIENCKFSRTIYTLVRCIRKLLSLSRTVKITHFGVIAT